jgi:hypothetical protein
MAATKQTFWGIMNREERIEIPIIQRDYAQGRKDQKATEIRTSILDNIYNTLHGYENPIDFDFIYGTSANGFFIPLDGQQRLTTLFLVHWYLAVKDHAIVDVRHLLEKFTYKTRTSSRDFCEALVRQQSLIPEPGSSMIDAIEDSHWFYSVWQNDPTIGAMLTMLEAIHERFSQSEGLFEKLVDDNRKLISFWFLEITQFGMTDNLYIKMNARGRELTEFENFKARFEQFIAPIHPEMLKYFEKNIDNKWTDFFWDYRQNNLIDGPFMNFFKFITEMLYYEGKPSIKNNSTERIQVTNKIFEEVYLSKGNLSFLFASLNVLSDLKNTNQFFKSLFTDYGYQKPFVALLDSSVDLFQRCLDARGFDIKEKVLFYLILKHKIINHQDQINDDFLDRIRIIRNLLLRVRQRKNTDILPDLRYNDLPIILSDLSKLLDMKKGAYDWLISGITLPFFGKSIENERQKAGIILEHLECREAIHALEDHYLLKGSIHNLDIETNWQELASFVKAVNEIWPSQFDENHNTLIVRAFLAIGDFCINIGDSGRFFFGNDNRWHTVLTITEENDAKKVSKVLPAFLLKYLEVPGSTPGEKLQFIIDEYLARVTVKDWFYYFIRYQEMLSGNNLFVWNDDSDFDIRNLNRNTLRGYHINPYVRTVAALIGNPEICDVHECYSQGYDKSPLYLKNEIALFCEEEGWRIVLPENSTLPPSLLAAYKLEGDPGVNTYWLMELDGEDRVELAWKFIMDLYSF